MSSIEIEEKEIHNIRRDNYRTVNNTIVKTLVNIIKQQRIKYTKLYEQFNEKEQKLENCENQYFDALKQIQQTNVYFDLVENLKIDLRHKVPNGIRMKTDGSVKVDDLLLLPKYKQHGITAENISNIVKPTVSMTLINDSMTPSYNGWYVRATKGHSIKGIKSIKPNCEKYKRITIGMSEKPKYRIVCYGTVDKNWKDVMKNGICRGSKTNIEFLPSNNIENYIFPGMEWKYVMLVYIYLETVVRDEIPCYLVDNMILTPGLNDIIDTKYFVKITEFKDGKIGSVLWARKHTKKKKGKTNAFSALCDYAGRCSKTIPGTWVKKGDVMDSNGTYLTGITLIFGCGRPPICKQLKGTKTPKKLWQKGAKDILQDLNEWDPNTMYVAK
eukprot:13905_1